MGYIADVALDVVPPSNPGDLQPGGDLVSTRPPWIPAPNCAKILVQFVEDLQPCESVFYVFQSAGNPTYTDCIDIATTLLDLWTVNVIPLWNDNTELTAIVVSDAGDRYGAVYTLPVEPHIPGTKVGEGAPNTLGIGVGFKTGLKGRSQSGRLCHTGNVEVDFALSLPVDGTRSAILDAYIVVMNGLHTGGWTLAVVSFMSDRKWRTTAQVTTVALLSVAEFIYTMRRRLPGHNRHR